MNLRRTRSESDVSPNITPLIDVVFLLLIFFMVSTTFDHSSEINIVLPEATEEALTTQLRSIRVLIGPQGEVHVNREPVQERTLPAIQEALSQAAADMAEAEEDLGNAPGTVSGPDVIISADAKTSHQSVIQVMDAARNIGLVKITFAVKRIPGSGESAPAPAPE